MNLMKQLLNDETGFVVSSELVLIATILVIGVLTGLTTLRTGVIQELADVSAAIGAISQTYQFNGVTAHTSATNGSAYVDNNDFCELATQAAAAAPSCMVVTGVAVAGTPEAPAPVILAPTP
ncbi:MAG TPA: hypothetical protein VNQ76_10940 [Planctomicrobium sp.]|nr:hypothetical protein [Planctomicrobium sp.]